ncbi:MAG: heat-inducible transcriptional repressor HrcA, partial [Clostridiales bacterium]
MDKRKKLVLNAIIEDYIANAEPVGSRAVAKKYGLGVSPATIRNEMSDLEEEGYIEQPHTSSGRVPSDKGYRFYVDNLMEKAQPTIEETRVIRDALTGSALDINDFLHNYCNMISHITNYPAMIAPTERGQGQLLRLQLIPVPEQQVLVVMLASTGILRHKLLDLPFALSDKELAALEADLSRLTLSKDMQQLNFNYLQDQLQELGLREKLFSQTTELL